MRTFEIYVEDDRYSVPTLHLATLADEELARSAAEHLMRDSTHHRGAEVCEHGQRLFGMGSMADRNRTDDGAADRV